MPQLKRSEDYKILNRLETQLALLTQSVENIDRCMNKDNGVKCVMSRLREIETFMIQSKVLAYAIPAILSGISTMIGIWIGLRSIK